MAENYSTEELDEKLSMLEQNFFRELGKIAEQRLKLQRYTLSSIKGNISMEKCLVRNTRIAPKTLTVRLESSVGEKLAQARGTADGLEDKLQDMRIAFEDKLKTVDRMKAELDRREDVLISSIRQIEAYMRAVFYLKQDADKMLTPLRKTAKEQGDILRKLTKEIDLWKNKKKSLSEAIPAFQPAKFCLEKMLSDYSRIQELVEYYLVLELLQEDLLAEESKCTAAEEKLAVDRQTMSEFVSRVPAALVSKESTLLDLNSKLKKIRIEITQLEEQRDAAIISRVKDNAARYDIQKWIEKLYSASLVFKPADKVASLTIDRLKGIRDFAIDFLDIAERLKRDEAI